MLNCKILFLRDKFDKQHGFSIIEVKFASLNIKVYDFLLLLLIPLQYKISFKIFIKNYSKVLFSSVILSKKIEGNDAYLLGDVNRWGWYEYYYRSQTEDRIPKVVQNRFSGNIYYKVVLNKTRYGEGIIYGKDNEYFLKKTTVKIQQVDLLSAISIMADYCYVLEAVEAWALLAPTLGYHNSTLIFEEDNENIDITMMDKIEVIDTLSGKLTKTKKKQFIVVIFFDKDYFIKEHVRNRSYISITH